MQSQSSTNMFSDYLLWWQLNWFDDVKSLIDGAFYKMSWSKRSFANTFFFIVKFPSIHLSNIRPTDTKLINDDQSNLWWQTENAMAKFRSIPGMCLNLWCSEYLVQLNLKHMEKYRQKLHPKSVYLIKAKLKKFLNERFYD